MIIPLEFSIDLHTDDVHNIQNELSERLREFAEFVAEEKMEAEGIWESEGTVIEWDDLFEVTTPVTQAG